MRIERITAAAAGGERQAPRGAAPADPRHAQGDERKPGQARGNALVAIHRGTQAKDPLHVMHGRPASPFIAQLLANSMGLAQTRERRRLAADEASLRYGAANDLDVWPALDRRGARSI